MGVFRGKFIISWSSIAKYAVTTLASSLLNAMGKKNVKIQMPIQIKLHEVLQYMLEIIIQLGKFNKIRMIWYKFELASLSK